MQRYDRYFDPGFRRNWGPWGPPRQYDRDFHRGYDRSFRDMGFRDAGYGYDRGFRSDYDEFARRPFMPESAYRRHPEYENPRLNRPGPWLPAGKNLVEEEDLSDDEILDAVHNNMEEDNWIDTRRIQVTVEDGIVTLRGEVDDYLEARYAWDDAWEAEGVRGVINHLTVRTDQPST